MDGRSGAGVTKQSTAVDVAGYFITRLVPLSRVVVVDV